MRRELEEERKRREENKEKLVALLEGGVEPRKSEGTGQE
jgi:hypothetical protein